MVHKTRITMRVEMEEILVAKLAMILKTASTPTPPLGPDAL